MKHWAAPLGVFVFGNLYLLLATLVMPALDTSVATLSSETEDIASTFWGWEWLMTQGVVRFLVYLLFEGLILWATAKTFLAVRDRSRYR